MTITRWTVPETVSQHLYSSKKGHNKRIAAVSISHSISSEFNSIPDRIIVTLLRNYSPPTHLKSSYSRKLVITNSPIVFCSGYRLDLLRDLNAYHLDRLLVSTCHIGSNTQPENSDTLRMVSSRRRFKVKRKHAFYYCRRSFCEYRGLAKHEGSGRRKIGALRTIENKLPAKLKPHGHHLFGEGIKDTSIKVYSNTNEMENMQKKLRDSSVQVTLRYRPSSPTEYTHFPSTSVLSRSALAEDETHGGIRATGVVEVAFFNIQKRNHEKGGIACSVSLSRPLVMSFRRRSRSQIFSTRDWGGIDDHASKHVKGLFRHPYEPKETIVSASSCLNLSKGKIRTRFCAENSCFTHSIGAC